jgi:hypothetical protein
MERSKIFDSDSPLFGLSSQSQSIFNDDETFASEKSALRLDLPSGSGGTPIVSVCIIQIMP